MTNRISRRALACALLATTTLSMPAIASAETPAPKFIDAIDDHGIDLATGLPFLTIEEGGIGSGKGRVAMQRIWAEGAGWADNWTGGLYPVTSGGTTKMFVQFAGISDTFSGSGTFWTSDKGDGATLTVDAQGSWTYTARDGTVIRFDPTQTESGTSVNTAENCPGADPTTCQVPLSITRPDGLQFALTWTQKHLCQDLPGEPCAVIHTYQRLFGVTSSAGYSFTVGYLSDTLGTWPNPNPNWFTRTSLTFGNSANPPSPAPTVTYSYLGGTISVTDPASRTWMFTTDASNRITGVQRPGSSSNNISYAYGADGTVSSSTRDGVTNGYSRSVAGATATETRTDPVTHQRVVTADTGIGRPTSDTNELGNTISYTYDASARLTQITAPEANAVQYGYDSRGNVTTTTQVAKPGSGLSNIVTSASFDATCGNIVTCNKPNSTTDANGNVTTYAYDPTHGGVTSVTQPAPASGAVQPQTRYSYAQVAGIFELTGISQCQMTASCTGTADETKVTAAYNSNLLPISLTREDGTGALAATSAMTYDARGNLLTIDGPLAGTADTTAFKYDSADELTGEISPDPDGTGALPNRAIRLTYRPDGQVSKQELGTTMDQSDAAFSAMTVKQTVDVAFDSNSRPVTQQLSAAGTDYALTQADYDSLGRVNCTATRMNIAVYGSLPASACTLSTQGSFGPDQISQNVYDAAGELTDLKVGVGTSDAATERHLTYSANGVVSSLLDGENNLTAYVHDGFDRLSQTFFSNQNKGADDTNGVDNEQLSYDANSNVTQRRVRSGAVIVYDYDHLNRIGHKGGSAVSDRDYTYDNLGRLLTATFSGGGPGVTNAYDALGRLTSSSSNMGGTARAMSYQYDLAGNRTRLTWWDGFFIDYDRLVTGEISAVRENGATSGTGVLASYGYDDLGNRTGATFGNGTSSSYGYDPVSRLSSLTDDLAGTSFDLTKTFAYDPASEITTETRSNDNYSFAKSDATTTTTTNGLNQIATVNGASATYDANGNMTLDPTTGRTFAYNVEDQLTSSALGGTTTTLAYDPLGRLDSYNPGTFTRFVYDGVAVAAEVDASGVIQHRNVRTDDPDELLVIYSSAGAASHRWVTNDERGSVLVQADATGVAQAIGSYDEYGVPGSTNTGRFGYTGQMWLPEVGVNHFPNRDYLPPEGVFAQPDPTGQADDPNTYTYTRDNPVNLVDPTGLTPCTEETTVCGHCTGGTVAVAANTPAGIMCVAESEAKPKENQVGPGGSFGPAIGTPEAPTTPVAPPPPPQNSCTSSGGTIGSTIIDRVGDAHASIFAAASQSAKNSGNIADAATIAKAGVPGAVVLGALSEGIAAVNDHANGMSIGRSAAVHGGGFVGGLVGGFFLGEAVEPLGGGIVGAIVAAIAGGYAGTKAGEAAGASVATVAGVCR